MRVLSNFIHFWISFDTQVETDIAILTIKYLSLVPFMMAVLSSYGINGLLVIGADNLYGKISGLSFVTMLILTYLIVPITPFYGGVIALLISRGLASLYTYLVFNFKNIS